MKRQLNFREIISCKLRRIRLIREFLADGFSTASVWTEVLPTVSAHLPLERKPSRRHQHIFRLNGNRPDGISISSVGTEIVLTASAYLPLERKSSRRFLLTFRSKNELKIDKIVSILILFLMSISVFAQKNRDFAFSGVFESSVSANAGAGDAKDVSYGIEEYANIRMQKNIGDKATFFSAVNLIAAAGDYALIMAADTNANVWAKKNYAAAIELERLYFKLRGKNLNFDGGLQRIPFGYGQVFKSSDFLNPYNPIRPDARPTAVLGGALSWFSPKIEEFKILSFATAGRNPFEQDGGLAGISAEKHWNRASAQLLYSFEHSDSAFPATSSNPFIHRAGMSLKADLELGFVLDMLYTHNKEIDKKADGLSFSGGFDYSFFDAKLLVLAEYLYNGAASSTSVAGGGNFSNKNYVYAGATWLFSSFTNAGIALISSIDDSSFLPIITFNHELFQGATLALTAQIPMDKTMFYDDANKGELGPIPPNMSGGSHFYFETKLKIRF